MYPTCLHSFASWPLVTFDSNQDLLLSALLFVGFFCFERPTEEPVVRISLLHDADSIG
jgi:hypothetical protein